MDVDPCRIVVVAVDETQPVGIDLPFPVEYCDLVHPRAQFVQRDGYVCLSFVSEVDVLQGLGYSLCHDLQGQSFREVRQSFASLQFYS